MTDDHLAPQTPREELDRLNALFHGLVSALEKRGILTATQLARAIERARTKPNQWLDLTKDEDDSGK